MDLDPHAAVVALVRRCRDGDERSWAALIDRFENLVYSIPRRMGLSSDDADDVFQSTFLALYRNLDRLDEPAAIGKWLAVTAARESLRVKRLSAKTVTIGENDRQLDEIVADEDATADVTASFAADADTVRAAVLGLPDKCRRLLSLLYLADEPSYLEISDELGMAVGSIGPTRARCLEKLRATLSKSGFFDEDPYQELRDGPHTPVTL